MSKEICPLKNWEGNCPARLAPCAPGDETCLAVIRAYFCGKHLQSMEKVVRELERQNKERDEVIAAVSALTTEREP